MIAICLRGPAGAGKTTIAYELERSLRRKGFFCGAVGYVSADMFAHISMNCQYGEREMDLKYQNIELVIRNLAMADMDLIYDDTYRRTQDYQSIEALLQELNYRPIHKFFISAPLKTAIRRNRMRFWKERLTDDLIVSHYRFHKNLVVPGEITVDARARVRDSVRLMVNHIMCDPRKG